MLAELKARARIMNCGARGWGYMCLETGRVVTRLSQTPVEFPAPWSENVAETWARSAGFEIVEADEHSITCITEGTGYCAICRVAPPTGQGWPLRKIRAAIEGKTYEPIGPPADIVELEEGGWGYFEPEILGVKAKTPGVVVQSEDEEPWGESAAESAAEEAGFEPIRDYDPDAIDVKTASLEELQLVLVWLYTFAGGVNSQARLETVGREIRRRADARKEKTS